MKQLFFILFFFSSILICGQNLTYSGYIYNAGGSGAANVPVKLYKRTTPTLAGFTSQNNYNGHSYYRSTGSMTWTDARQACANMGGYLVTVTSAAENNFIFNLWPSGWIGLTDEVVEGQWRWVTGEPYSYSSWNPGEPNNAGNEDYVQFVGAGRWNDLPNNISLPYVIEFDYIVTFTPWVLHRTVYTDATGRYVINETTNPATEWYFQIDIPTPITPLQNSDAHAANSKAISRTFTSLDYYRYDVNNDGRINISDAYSIFMRRIGRFTMWNFMLPNTRLFTAAQYNIINTSTTDLRLTYPGVQSITINSPVNGGSSNYYLVNTGYSNSTSISY
jgi:Lectin C-type domain